MLLKGADGVILGPSGGPRAFRTRYWRTHDGRGSPAHLRFWPRAGQHDADSVVAQSGAAEWRTPPTPAEGGTGCQHSQRALRSRHWASSRREWWSPDRTLARAWATRTPSAARNCSAPVSATSRERCPTRRRFSGSGSTPRPRPPMWRSPRSGPAHRSDRRGLQRPCRTAKPSRSSIICRSASV